MTTATKTIRFSLLAIGTFCAFLFSCQKENTAKDDTENFDQKAMLANYADNIIIPSFTELSKNIGELNSLVIPFASNYSEAELQTIQQKWSDVYTSWTWANAYNFGPAGEAGIKKRLVEEIGTWPINVTGINSKISSMDTSFSDFQRDTRGLLAIEYLLYDEQLANVQIVSKFSSNPNRILYLKAAIRNAQQQVDAILNEWENGYRAEFIANTGTSVGSSTSLLYNEFVRSYESIKNFKLGIPLGKKAGQTSTEPQKVEARFSEKSLEFLAENTKAIEYCWLGKSKNNMNGIGWDDYLQSATGGNDLVQKTTAQQQNIFTELKTVGTNTSLQQQITANPAALENLYNEYQKQTRFYKSDMSSLLGISITFSDADGD